MYHTYILECADGSYYTGWTFDLERRLADHNAGKGSKYTRAHLPVRLIAHFSFESKQEAMQEEWRIKQLTRRQKEKLIGSFASAPR